MATLDSTMGALMISVIVSAVFYGVSCSQCYYYYTRYPRDPVYIKILVGAVWTTDTIHQVLISHTVYWYLVTNYGNLTSLGLLSPTIIVEVIFQALTGLFVQSFFAARVYRLSGKNLYLTVPVCILIALEFAIALVYSGKAMSFVTFGDLAKVKTLSIMINALAAGGDVLIAIILCTILQTSKTGFERSNLLVNRLIIFSVNTGLLTSVCACMSLITILSLPDTFVYICFFFLIGRLYSNSLMATLNSRRGLQAGTSSGEASVSLRDIHPNASAVHPSQLNTKRGDPAGIAIRIDTTKDTRRDLESDSTKYGSADKHVVEV